MNIEKMFDKNIVLKDGSIFNISQASYDELLTKEKLELVEKRIADIIKDPKTFSGRKKQMIMNGMEIFLPVRRLGLYDNLMREKNKLEKNLTHEEKEKSEEKMQQEKPRAKRIFFKTKYKHETDYEKDLTVMYALMPMITQKKVRVVSEGAVLESSEDFTLLDDTTVYRSDNYQGYATVKFADGEEVIVHLQLRKAFVIKLSALVLTFSILIGSVRMCQFITDIDLGDIPEDGPTVLNPIEPAPEEPIITPTPTPDLEEEIIDDSPEIDMDPIQDLDIEDDLDKENNEEEITTPNKPGNSQGGNNQGRPGAVQQTPTPSPQQPAPSNPVQPPTWPNQPPVVVPSPSPKPTPTQQPVVTPSPTPSPTPKPTPTPLPVVTPSPAPSPTPEPTPTPQPVVTPSPAPSPTPEPTPTPQPVVTPAPATSPEPEPQQTPQPVVTPTPDSNVKGLELTKTYRF